MVGNVLLAISGPNFDRVLQIGEGGEPVVAILQ